MKKLKMLGVAALAAATLTVGVLAAAPTASALPKSDCVAYEFQAEVYGNLGEVAEAAGNWWAAYWYDGLSVHYWELAVACYRR